MQKWMTVTWLRIVHTRLHDLHIFWAGWKTSHPLHSFGRNIVCCRRPSILVHSNRCSLLFIKIQHLSQTKSLLSFIQNDIPTQNPKITQRARQYCSRFVSYSIHEYYTRIYYIMVGNTLVAHKRIRRFCFSISQPNTGHLLYYYKFIRRHTQTRIYEISSFLFKHKLNYIMTYNIDTFDEEYLHWIDTGFVLHTNNTDSCMCTQCARTGPGPMVLALCA